MRHIEKSTVALVALALLIPSVAEALSKSDRKRAKQLLKNGPLYMRIDAPCETGRHPFGVYYSPVVEVSPRGSEEGEMGFNAGFYHMGSTQLSVRVNDEVTLDEMDCEDAECEIELDSSRGGHTVVKFIEIGSFDDFRAAFDKTFATRPLQDEHPDWPESIRSAIARRELVDGMNKRQAFYVVGSPERFEKFEENGDQVEVWTLRTDSGVKVGFWRAKVQQPGEALTIRFVNGALTGAGDRGGKNELSLDD